ncbi:hypothetical protein A1Q_3406 [Vibrio campbellii HY01]|nr:hypothetical protein A1Q_3406 [Vibrio campbellii HY01]
MENVYDFEKWSHEVKIKLCILKRLSLECLVQTFLNGQ